jgi:hypothetical protein
MLDRHGEHRATSTTASAVAALLLSQRTWTRPMLTLSLRSAVLIASLLAGAIYLSLGSICKHYALHEAELHARGLWRAPRLGVDAFIPRHVKSTGAWEVLLVQVRCNYTRLGGGRSELACETTGDGSSG